MFQFKATVDVMNETNSCEALETEWLSPAEAGKRFPGGIAASTIRAWAHSGRIEGAFQSPTGRWIIPMSSLRELVSEGVPGK